MATWLRTQKSVPVSSVLSFLVLSRVMYSVSFSFSKCMQLCCVLTGAQVPHKCHSQHSSRGVLCWSRLLWPFLNLADSAIAFHSQVSWSISCDRSQCDDWGHCGWRTRARKLGTRLWQKQWQHSHHRCGLQGALEIIYSAVLQLNISSCHRKLFP